MSGIYTSRSTGSNWQIEKFQPGIFCVSWRKKKKKEKKALETSIARVTPPPQRRRSLQWLSGAQDPCGALLLWHCSGTQSVGGRTHTLTGRARSSLTHRHAHLRTQSTRASHRILTAQGDPLGLEVWVEKRPQPVRTRR